MCCVWAFRYITALTDSDEDEQSDTSLRDEEPPVESLSLLFEKIECLHQGSESDKKESLSILLEKKEEVGFSSNGLLKS